MLLSIIITPPASLVFIFSLIEAIMGAVAGRTYWQWSVVAAIHFPLAVFLASNILRS